MTEMEAFDKNKYSYRITVMVFAVILIVYLFDQYFYPQRICSGEVTKKRIWKDGVTHEQKILDDEKTSLAISFTFKRGAIYLNDDKFPLYKELSGVNNFAEKTESGYKGEYSQYGILHQESLFKFSFNEVTSMLYTENSAKGMHVYENKMGDDYSIINFVGTCKRKFI